MFSESELCTMHLLFEQALEAKEQQYQRDADVLLAQAVNENAA